MGRVQAVLSQKHHGESKGMFYTAYSDTGFPGVWGRDGMADSRPLLGQHIADDGLGPSTLYRGYAEEGLFAKSIFELV